MILTKIYLKLPYLFKFLILNGYAVLLKRRRFGQIFDRKLTILNTSNPEKVDLVQFRNFIKLANKTRYWNNRFRQYDVDINAEDLVMEIKKLPIISKAEVKLNIEDIIFKPLNDKIINVSTSGTTGSGMSFPITVNMECTQWAVWWRYRMSLGIKLGDRMGWFGGKSILSKNCEKIFIRNIPLNQIMFNPFNLNQKNISKYHDAIKKNNISWLHGYPSQISLLAHLLIEGDFPKLENIKIITLGAESLLEHQKKIIEQYFTCKVYQHYGLAEGVSNISQNIDNKFTLDQDFAYTELIAHENSTSKIVGTNYNNTAFPLIRYDTGDFVEIDKKTGEIISIDGRKEDYITLDDGSKLGRLDHVFKNFQEIKEAQIFQNKKGAIELRVVLINDSINRNVLTKNLLAECSERFGKQTKVSINFLDEIEKTSRGKLKFVISEIK